jgi:type II secretory ATPase GspE/PulE/Tfp pilus assembly ATPase PilB-like protein
MQESIQQSLVKQAIALDQALSLLVDPVNFSVRLNLVDSDLSKRFLRQIRDQERALPLLPLLLWRNCYYLGSHIDIPQAKLDELSMRLGSDIKIILIAEKSYFSWLQLQNVPQQNRGSASPNSADLEDISQITEIQLSRSNDQIDRIKTIINSAVQNRASDIHLEPFSEGLRIRFRIDGILRQIATIPPEFGRKVISSLKVMAEMDIADSRRPQDGRISEKYISSDQRESGLDLRVSTLPCISNRKGESGEKAVLRLLRQQNTFETIDDIGFTGNTKEIYKSWLKQPQGLIIFTGPTGSGKTSTLYTSLQAVANDSINIITVEDPVEYVLPGITQTQVNEAAGMTFAAGLRAILRQDPDIVMLGEIRDHETAETAIRAALTGHLVFTTLHTNDAIGAIPRLRDIGPDPGLISDALLGVVAQRLVRRICPHCSVAHVPSEADLKLLGLRFEDIKPEHTWRKGQGCSQCFHSGYLGREALIELLDIDDMIRQLIHEGNISDLQHYLAETEFASFRIGAIEKVTSGITTIEEICRVIPSSALNQSRFLKTVYKSDQKSKFRRKALAFVE